MVTNIKPALEVLLSDRAAHRSEQAVWLLDKSWEEITILQSMSHFEQGEEDYELDLKAFGLGFQTLPDQEDQVMFEPGEKVDGHEALDSLIRGE